MERNVFDQVKGRRFTDAATGLELKPIGNRGTRYFAELDFSLLGATSAMGQSLGKFGWSGQLDPPNRATIVELTF
jgi:hypothetical protein